MTRPAEIQLEPGWLAADVRRARSRVREWSGIPADGMESGAENRTDGESASRQILDEQETKNSRGR